MCFWCTNLTMATAYPDILQMLRKFESRLINGCIFQIHNPISHIDDTFVGMQCIICDQLINLTPHGIAKIRKFHLN